MQSKPRHRQQAQRQQIRDEDHRDHMGLRHEGVSGSEGSDEGSYIGMRTVIAWIGND
jgi:hypothetical protein